MNDDKFFILLGLYGVLQSIYLVFLAAIHYQLKPLVLSKNQRLSIYTGIASPLLIPGLIGLIQWEFNYWSEWRDITLYEATPVFCGSSILILVFLLAVFVFDDLVVYNLTPDQAMESLREVLSAKNIPYEDWTNRAAEFKWLGNQKYSVRLKESLALIVISSSTMLSTRIRFRRKWFTPVHLDFKMEFIENVLAKQLDKRLKPVALLGSVLSVIGAIFTFGIGIGLIYFGYLSK